MIALNYSPWSEKARWPLDHHRVTYRERQYSPVFGEPMLRLRTRNFFKPVTVPVLFDRGRVVADSFVIARRAEAIGSGAPLFPPERLDEIAGWNQAAEKVMAAGRALLVDRVGQDKQARRDYVPPWIPGPLKPNLGAMTASAGLWYFRRKYAIRSENRASWLDTMAAELDRFSRALEGNHYLFDQFSFADIAMAVALQFVRPLAGPTIPLGANSRVSWATPSVADEFPHLLDWRDRLFRDHRPARTDPLPK